VLTPRRQLGLRSVEVYSLSPASRRIRLVLPGLADLDAMTGKRVARGPHSREEAGRIPDGGGLRARGRAVGENRDRQRGTGSDDVHFVVADHSRLAYSEVFPDEKARRALHSSKVRSATSPRRASPASSD